MDDDDWGLSLEELDSLEKNAAAQLASRKNPRAPILLDWESPNRVANRHKSSLSTTATIAAAAPVVLDSDSPKGPVNRSNFSSSSRVAPIVLDAESPKRQRLDADVFKNYTAQKNVAPNRVCTSPTKKTGRELKVKVSRDEPGRIAVESPYHPDLVTALRTISGKRWDQARKVWTFPEGELDEVVRAMRSLPKNQIVIDADPSLPIRDDEHLIESSAERNVLQEGNYEARLPPQQSTSSQGTLDWGVRSSQSPPEDGAKSQPSQDGGSTRPLKNCTVRLFLHNSGKIAAKFEYDTDVIAAIRRIPKADWNSKEKLWMFPFSSLVESETILSNVSSRIIKVEPLVPLVKRALEATSALPDLQERYDSIPEHLRKTLMDFQVEGVRFSLQHGGRALIADEMGLGKTLQALAVVSCLKEDWPVLIIVPSSLRLNWATMLEKWLLIDPSLITIVMSQGGNSREGYNIVRTTGKQELRLHGVFNIVSYDVLAKLEDLIYLSDFQIVIADESHYMKNPTAKRTNACVPVLQKAKYALLLTGTPALSRPIEMFKQLEALQPSVYKKMDEYGRRYCMGGYFGVWQGSSNHDELHALVKSTVMIRRLKKDVMKQLPKKRREQVFISLDDKGGKKLHELMKQLDVAKKEHRVALARKDAEESQRLNFAERQLLSQIYSESAEAKLPAVQDYLTTMIEASCKFLVFAHHHCMLEGIQELLQKKKVKFIRIDGKTPASARQDLVRSFQEQPDVMVALLGIRAAGVGLTLTAASTVIFAEMSWTPGDLVQAEDRVHRIGQESAVNVYYLHANGSVDDLIWDAVQHKLENLGQVLDGDGESSMKVASKSTEHGGPSITQETLDPYLRPCVNPSAAPSEPPFVRKHVAEVMSSSQAEATIEAFLRPFEMGKDASAASSGQRAPPPADRAEDAPTSRAETGQEHIDLEDDITEVGGFDSRLGNDRLMQDAPERKKSRFT
ncbi:unnamed protein product [Calypogeia fissa]